MVKLCSFQYASANSIVNAVGDKCVHVHICNYDKQWYAVMFIFLINYIKILRCTWANCTQENIVMDIFIINPDNKRTSTSWSFI